MFRLFKNRFTYLEMLEAFQLGVIGTIEFRNWMEQQDKTWKKARRKDVDKMIEEFGERVMEPKSDLDRSDPFVPYDEDDD